MGYYIIVKYVCDHCVGVSTNITQYYLYLTLEQAQKECKRLNAPHRDGGPYDIVELSLPPRTD
jgi:hypothetical protein